MVNDAYDSGLKLIHAPDSRAPRDAVLDLLKGELVIIMVVYHTMNFFTTAEASDYVYVRFISGSFVLISGYIIVRFYHAAFAANWRKVSRRLVVRGFKLVALFTALNLLIGLTGWGNPTKTAAAVTLSWSRLFAVYVIGEPRAASFQILLPIGYLLIAAPTLLAVSRSRILFVAATLLAILAASCIPTGSANVEYSALGLIGILGGMLVNARICFPQMRTPPAVGCLVVVVLAMKYLSANLATYALGASCILKLLYDLSARLPLSNMLAQSLSLLGKYSLLSYIAQILFLQLLAKALSRPNWPLGGEALVVICVTVTFLVGMCAGLNWQRRRSDRVAVAYKLVFD